MQLISLGALATDAAKSADFQLALARVGEFVQRDDVRWLRNFAIAMFVGTQLLNVGWCWIASKIVVRGENATIGNAFKIWLASLLLPLGLVAGLLFFGPFVIEHLGGMSPTGAWALIGAFLFLCVLLCIAIPVKIYEIELLNALGFVLLTIVLAAIGNGTAQFVAGNLFQVPGRLEAFKNAAGKTDGERRAFTQRLFGKDAPDEIDRLLDDAMHPIGNPKPLAGREAAIQAIQQKLEARRRALPLGDPKVRAAFQNQFDRYMRLLNQAKADRAASLAAPKKP